MAGGKMATGPRRFFGFVILSVVLGCPVSIADAQAKPNADSPLGNNLDFFADWSPELPLVDVFPEARQWVTHCFNCSPFTWDTREESLLDLDANGWVKSLPTTHPPTYTSVGT